MLNEFVTRRPDSLFLQGLHLGFYCFCIFWAKALAELLDFSIKLQLHLNFIFWKNWRPGDQIFLVSELLTRHFITFASFGPSLCPIAFLLSIKLVFHLYFILFKELATRRPNLLDIISLFPVI